MKHQILLKTITALFFTANAIAQPVQEWAARYDQSNNSDVFLDMIQDDAGNTYVCGYSDALATGTDIVVAKFELDGDTAWIYRYEGAGEDKAVAIALTNNNDVVVAGHSEQPGTAKDMITILISGTTGMEMNGWPQLIDGPDNSDDWANDVSVRQSDNLIAVCGASTELNELGKTLITYAPSGVIDWTGNQLNTSGQESYNLSCEFFNNGTLITLQEVVRDWAVTDTLAEYSIVNVDNGQLLASNESLYNGPTNPSYEKLYVRDFTVHNNSVYVVADWREGDESYGDYFAVYRIEQSQIGWVAPILVSAYAEPSGNATGISVNSNNVYVSGYEDVNPLNGVDWNGFVATFNRSSGAELWHENYGGNEDDRFFDIAIDNLSNANSYVTGFTTVNGNRNIVKAKFTSTGLLDWDMQYNGTGSSDDEAYRIAIGNGSTVGSIWVCGKSVGQGTGDDGIAIKCCIPPIADAGLDKGFCTGTGVQIGAASISGYTYEWTPTTGLSDAAISNPTVSHSAATDCPIEYEYVVKVTNANGCSAYDTVQVTEYHYPEVSIVTSQPNVICENEPPIVITPTIDTGCEGLATYSWEQDNVQVNTSSDPYEVSAVSQTGNYTLVVTNSYGSTSCTTTSNSVSATVNPLPVGSATDATICDGETTNIQMNSSITGTTFSWDASATGTVAGEADASGSTIAQTLTGSGSVTYLVTPTVTATGCVGDDFSVTATVNPLPAAPTVTPDGPTEFCDGGSVTLTSSAGTTYSWSPNGESSASISVDVSGSYEVTVSDVNGCDNTSASLVVTVNDNPVADAGPDLTFCEGFSQFIGGSPTATGGQGGYTYTWSNGSNLDDATAENPNILTSLMSGNYSFTVTVSDQNNCEGEDQALVTVLDELVADAGQDQTVCAGDTVQLLGTGGDEFSWSPSAGLDATSISDPMASPSDTTEYQLIVSADGCEDDTARVTINVAPLPPQPTLTVSGLQITCNESGYSYQWYLDGVELVGETSQTLANADQQGGYTVTITDVNGCSSTSDSVMPVSVKDVESFQLTVYPNPSNGQFELVTPRLLEEGWYQIFDNLGKLIQEGNIVSDRTQISLSENAEGVYVLRLLEGNQPVGIERLVLLKD